MFEMDDLPMKAGHRDLNNPIPPKRLSQEKRELMSKPFPPSKTPTARQITKSRRRAGASNAQTAKTTKRPVKRLPPLGSKQTEQPRDHLGRFARKTGQVLKGALFGTAHVIGGTVAAAHEGYKTVKRIRRKGRSNAGKSGLVKRKRVVRRRKRVSGTRSPKRGCVSRKGRNELASCISCGDTARVSVWYCTELDST